MSKRMKLLLLTIAFGAGAFAFSAGMTARVAQAGAECNCVAYTCPWNPELQCIGHWTGVFCDYLNLHCDCPPCP